MADPTGWQPVRCPSPTCDRAHLGGRVMFTRCGDMYVKVSKNGSAIFKGEPLGFICRCGYHWKNPLLVDTTPRTALECH